MFDHIGITVKDLDASVRFYTALLAPLGLVLCSRDDSSARTRTVTEASASRFSRNRKGASSPQCAAA